MRIDGTTAASEGGASEDEAAPGADAPAAAERGASAGGRMALAAAMAAKARATSSDEAADAAEDAAPAKEPAIPRGPDFKGVKYGDFAGDLWTTPMPHAGAVGQGSIGDCFFLSALASVARMQPQTIKDAVKANGDGTYTVTFKDRAKDGTVTDVPITVDPKVPLDGDGKPAFATGLEPAKDTGHAELWPMIFEKAYAQWKGGYSKLNQGGYGDKTLTALTGAASSDVAIDGMSDDDLWKMLDDAAKAKEPMVCGSRPAKELKKATGDKKMDAFVEDHDYSILATFVRDGKRYVKVRNPWGDTSPKVPGLYPRTDVEDKGVFDLSVSEFQKYFADVMIAKTPPRAPLPKPAATEAPAAPAPTS